MEGAFRGFGQTPRLPGAVRVQALGRSLGHPLEVLRTTERCCSGAAGWKQCRALPLPALPAVDQEGLFYAKNTEWGEEPGGLSTVDTCSEEHAVS